MSFTMRSLAAPLLLFLGPAMAHMTLTHPVPFGNATLTTTPLNNAKPGSQGSDYPCKQRQGVYDIAEMNNMAVNEPVSLTFGGSASHGGGTCQIAVTLDKEPSVASVFKIVKVYEGGCPTAGDGNDGSDGNFTFTIPTGFPSGQASLAWVWYNKIGNREVYMNCAPITVTGGSQSKEVFNSLPNLYLINLPTSECATGDTSDIVVPNPGKDVVKGALVTFKPAAGPSCAASAAAQTSELSGYQTTSSDSNSTQSVSSTSGDIGATPAPGSYGGSASSMVTISTSAPVSYSGGATSMVTVSTSAAAYFAPSATTDSPDAPTSYPTLIASSGAGIYGPGTAAGTAASSTAAPAASGTTCPTNGALVCNGRTQFGLCNNGNVVWQAVADGTSCSNGQIQKRSAFRHAHVRRHVQNVGFGHGA